MLKAADLRGKQRSLSTRERAAWETECKTTDGHEWKILREPVKAEGCQRTKQKCTDRGRKALKWGRNSAVSSRTAELPKGQQWSGHRNLSQRWEAKRQKTSEKKIKPQLFVLDMSQGLENMTVKIKERRVLNIWRWKTKVLFGCERKNRVIRTKILTTHRSAWRKRQKTHSICSGKLIASSQVRIQSQWQRQNWILFCNCRMWIILEMSIKQRANTSREHGCKKDTLKWRGFKQR